MRIAVWAESGIGGTEKAASIFAVELARRGYEVDYLTHRKGARSAYLSEGGAQIWEGTHETHGFEEYLRQANPDVIHQHVPGYAMQNPIYPTLEKMGQKRPALIETNIFGRFEDPRSEGLVQFRMFVSRASATQAFRRAGRRMTFEVLERCCVLNNPLLPRTAISEADRLIQRRELGVSNDEVLAVRIGQPGRGKWTDWEFRAFLQARREFPKLRLLLMEPPPEFQAKLRGARGVIVLPATSDFDRINRIYAAADLMIHASYFGESYGYTIAEAMQAGLPVVTRSTPWGDNAQVELVENRVSGFVCATIDEMARRFADLASDRALRIKMGIAGAKRIAELSDPIAETSILEAVIRSLTTGQRDVSLDERRRQLLAFGADFPDRQHTFSETFRGRVWEWFQWKGYSHYRFARTFAGKVFRAFKSLGRNSK